MKKLYIYILIFIFCPLLYGNTSYYLGYSYHNYYDTLKGEKNTGLFEFGMEKTKDDLKASNFVFDLSLGLSDKLSTFKPVLTKSSNYISVPEAYYSKNLSSSSLKRSEISFGRKNINWSFSEKFWSLDIWEPLFYWSALDTKNLGLLGLFYNFQQGPYNLTLFGSYLNLPTQGPNFEEKNGELVSENPWFNQPIKSIEVLNSSIFFNFNIDYPSLGDYLFQPSLGGRFEINSDQALLGLSMMYQPSHIPSLPFEGQLDLSSLPPNQADLNIYPEVFNQLSFGMDLSILLPNNNFYFYFSHVTPDEIKPSATASGLFYQDYGTLFYGGLTWEFFLKNSFASSLSFLEVFKDEVTTVGSTSNLDYSLAENRLRFNRAIKWAVTKSFDLGHTRNQSKLKLNSVVTRSFINKGTFLNLSSELVRETWSLMAGAGFLRSERGSLETSFAESNKNADNFYLGLKYLFN